MQFLNIRAPVRNKRQLISIVDDDEPVREAVKGLMRSMGFPTVAFASGADFLQSPVVVRTGCLIADVNMPGMSGFDLHGHLSAQGHAVPTVLITAYPAESARTFALASGVIAYLTKPFVEADLSEAVRIALARRR